MKTKPLIFLLALNFLLLFSGSVYGGDFVDDSNSYERNDYKEAFKLRLPLAEQGADNAKFNLGGMYYIGEGVPQDDKEALKWYRLSAEQRLAVVKYKYD